MKIDLAAAQTAPRKFRLRWLLLWLAAAALLYFALRGIPLAQVAEVLSGLTAGQIALIAGLNLLIVSLMTVRWWMVQRSLGWPVPLFTLAAYRLAGFALSYFTPGPQFGGEPLQVHLLHARRGVPLQTAVASVFTDRLIDLLANFTFLVIGSVVIALGGLLGGWAGGGVWTLAVGLLLLPLGHMLALRTGKRPASWLAERLLARSPRLALHKAVRVAREAEEQVAGLIREQPWLLARLIGISALIWGMAVLEFQLVLGFLGASPQIAETISALTAARLAFLLPLPAGLGSLEAGQSLATSLLGWGAATGIAASLVIRARDVLLALLGLFIGGVLTRSTIFRNRISGIQQERSS